MIDTPISFPAGITGLVLSGGGSKGSWQEGVLRYLADAGGGPYVEGFAVASGTSVGALGALAMAQFPPGPGQIRKASALLRATWARIRSTSDVFRPRFPPYVAALAAPSVFTVEPLRALLRDTVSVEAIRASGVKLRLTAVDLLSGESVIFTEESSPLVGAGMASASFPIAFPPESMGGRLLTDGGVREVAPLRAALAAGCDRVLVLACRDPDQIPKVERDRLGSAINVGMRVLEIMENEILRGDLRGVRHVNRLVAAGAAPGRRHLATDVLAPSVPLGDPLDFSAALISRQQDQGYEDARRHFAPASAAR